MVISPFVGMFLFAKLVLNNLAKQPTRERFCADITTARFPKDLNLAEVTQELVSLVLLLLTAKQIH